ncbi:MAG: hypothetical protein K8H88_19125 [Sandaracinaceae bacterium]|nr:hypothetical protein [Sandaracinaceae bacterium]
MRTLSWLTVLLVACSPSGAPPTPGGFLTPAEYCGVSGTSGIAAWSGGVLTACPTPEAIDEAPSGCAHYRVEAGRLRPLELTGARLAWGAANGAIVVWGEDGSLRVRASSGAERLLAPWATDPSVGPSGTTVAYLTTDTLDEEGEPIPGEPLRVVLHSIESGTGHTLASDAEAASPFALPDGSGVLYVSTRTGVASIWRARRDGETQLTNAGLAGVEQGFVPVPAGELIWIARTSTAIFTARYDDARLWQLDAQSGEASELGPGSLPQLADATSVLALGGTEAGCAARYTIGRTP